MPISVNNRVSFGGVAAHGTVKATGLSVCVPTATGQGGVTYSTNSTGVSVLFDGVPSQQVTIPAADLIVVSQ
jgi:hypothetical protein